MIKQNNFFIIGPTGAGKTTVGRLLAEKLKLNFYDTDTEIEKKIGMSISQIFAKEGEAGFRQHEEKIITELTTLTDTVLAIGAGAILSEKNRLSLSTQGTIIYLQVSLEQQHDRIKQCTNRPLLQSVDQQTVLKKMQQNREKLYQHLANFNFTTDNLTVDVLLNTIIDEIYSIGYSC